METGKNVFITGPGGTGKTELIKYYYRRNNETKNIGITSLTGSICNFNKWIYNSFIFRIRYRYRNFRSSRKKN